MLNDRQIEGVNAFTDDNALRFDSPALHGLFAWPPEKRVLFRTVRLPVLCQFDRVGHKNAKERLRKETLSSVVKEMAKPRLAASVAGRH